MNYSIPSWSSEASTPAHIFRSGLGGGEATTVSGTAKYFLIGGAPKNFGRDMLGRETRGWERLRSDERGWEREMLARETRGREKLGNEKRGALCTVCFELMRYRKKITIRSRWSETKRELWGEKMKRLHVVYSKSMTLAMERIRVVMISLGTTDTSASDVFKFKGIISSLV
jgi:hypothetical protein